MPLSPRARYWTTYTPGLLLSVVACPVSFVVLRKYRPATVGGAQAPGAGLYVAVLGIVNVALNSFGPSRIM